MKKLTIIFLLLFTLSTSGGYAQNSVNIDNLRFNFTYRALPSKPLKPMFFYYKVYLNAPASVSQVVDGDFLLDKITIDGQRRTNDFRPGDVEIVLNLGYLNILSADVTERIEEVKDKVSKETRKKLFYSMVVTYNFEATATVSVNGKKIKTDLLYSRVNPMRYISQEYNSRKEASEYWRNNRTDLIEILTRDLSESSVGKFSPQLTPLYGFPTVKTTDIIKTIDEKKHPENESLRAASDKLKSKLEAMDANTPMLEADVADLIDYFKGILTRYTDPKMKTDVRLRYVALYNLCKIYLYLDQPEKVREYADQIYTNGHDKGDAKKLNENADKLALQFKTSNGIETRHFDPDTFFAE